MGVDWLNPKDLGWANAIYAQIGFQPSTREDRVAVASVEGRRAALGRLVPAGCDAHELGGIYVDPEYRGRRLARAVVEFLLGHAPSGTLYCIPFAHLDGFYRGFGFAPVPEGAAVPAAVASKVAWCGTQYIDPVRLLVRRPAGG